MIYTSGTTGRPKGVRLANSSWTYLGVAVEAYDILYPDDLQYLWLPLSHVFGKALIAVQLRIGFATAVDGRIDKIVENLGAGTAHLHGRRAADLREGAGPGDDHRRARRQGQDLRLGVRVAQGSPLRLTSKEPAGLLGIQYGVADRLVFSKLKARMGGNIRFFVRGPRR